jgi:hypothetical protein
MRKHALYLSTLLLLVLANPAPAGSLHNSDPTPYNCEIKSRMGVSQEKVYPSSTVYFDCTYGCEITLIKTGQTITIETDQDLIIADGELKVRE